MHKLLIILTIVSLNIQAQEEKDWMEYEASKNNTSSFDSAATKFDIQKDSLSSLVMTDTLTLAFTGPEKEVKISQSKMINELIELIGTPTSPDGVLLNGYRIQIHFGQEKNEANQERANFIARYDDIPVYLDYHAPNFRVRVGDFRNRLEAEKYKSELQPEYPGLIIVHDKIKLPPIPEKEDIEMD